LKITTSRTAIIGRISGIFIFSLSEKSSMPMDNESLKSTQTSLLDLVFF